jgi:hypothetical protein
VNRPAGFRWPTALAIDGGNPPVNFQAGMQPGILQPAAKPIPYAVDRGGRQATTPLWGAGR